MKREVYEKLLKWKNNNKKKPLLLQGARQVGKTFIVKEFGKKEYKNFYYFNFEQDENLHHFFKSQLLPENIIENLSIYIGKKIESDSSLIFFDEIQVLPEVLTSLKYFQEQAPQYNIISAGSLLGVSIASHKSFPVGKVNFLTLYPMSFLEFLEAIEGSLLLEKIKKIDESKPLNEVFHNKLISHLKLYLYIGGMPEAIQDYIDNKDIARVRKIQLDILESYKRDFSKYNNSTQALKVSNIWHSVPYQLAKENKKFRYKDVKKNGRASFYELSIEWLKNAGLINVAYNISVPKMPLSGYADKSKIKLYLFDTGLLGAMLNISSKIIVDPNQLFIEYNGAFIENFVAQQLKVYLHSDLYYWTSKSDAEVDFLLQMNREIYPIEVKSGLSRNLKSLRSYESKYHPLKIYRLSPRNMMQDDTFVNIPLYAVHYFKQLDNND